MKIKEFFLQNKKFALIVATVVLIIVFISILVGMNSEKRNLQDSPIREIGLQIYYSKSSRDDEKREQYNFKLGDPIQANVIFANVYEKTPITLEVIGKDNKIVQSSDFEIGGTENSFVTIGSASEKGSYDVVIKYQGNQIASKGFRVE